jgi:hypothetical protein
MHGYVMRKTLLPGKANSGSRDSHEIGHFPKVRPQPALWGRHSDRARKIDGQILKKKSVLKG